MTKTRDLADLGGGFIQAGTGAVQRTVESKLQDVVSVKDFGAVGDGVADDTAAIQSALTSIPSSGGLIYIPTGTYKLSATLTISNKPISIFGDGIGLTILKWVGVSMVGQNGVTYTNTTFQSFLIQDLSIKALPNAGDVTQAAGTAVSISYPSTPTNLESTAKLLRVEIRPEISGGTQQGGWTECVYAKDAGRFSANNCNFAGRVALSTKGIRLATGSNAFFPVINNCDFTSLEYGIYSEGPSSPGGTVIESSNFTSCWKAIEVAVATDLLFVYGNYGQVYKAGVECKARTPMIQNNRFDCVDDPRALHPASDLYGILVNGVGSGPYDCGVISGNNIARFSTEPCDGIILVGSVTHTVVSNNTLGKASAYGAQTLRHGVKFDTGTTNNLASANVGRAATCIVTDYGANNIVRDNFPSTAPLVVTGTTPELKSGAQNRTLSNSVELWQTGATNVTNLLNGYPQQVITIIAADGFSTIKHGSTINLKDNIDYTIPGNRTLTLIYDGAKWREIGRN